MRELIAAEVIERLPVVCQKLKAGISHEQIIREGVAEWDYSAHVMGWYIVFATA